MSLNKAIEHNKEHRKQYRGAKVYDPTSRNHGGDPVAQQNREYHNKKREPIIEKNVDNEEK